MDEQRLKAYFTLIQDLLSCPDGRENALLEKHRELLDRGLVTRLLEEADNLRQQGDLENSNRFMNLARNLLEMFFDFSITIENIQVRFLLETLQKIFENPDPQIIYPFWAQNLDKIDDRLGEILEHWARETLTQVPSEQAYTIVSVIFYFSNLIAQFPLGNIAANREIAIIGYQIALSIFTFDAFTAQWAEIQINLDNTYLYRTKDGWIENLGRAIACYQEAQEVFTVNTSPQEWATRQNGIGIAYRHLAFITPNKNQRSERIEKAIDCYQKALQVYIREPDLQEERARTYNNLADVYCRRIVDNSEENIEKAIDYCQKVLEFCTFENFPQEWANAQNILGIAFCNRTRGETDKNIESSITCYTESLKVYTHEQYPQNWAEIKRNLASAYIKRENLEQAIACCQEALTVFQPQDFPTECRNTTYLLANLYTEENRWTEAIETYRLALEAVEILYEDSVTLTGKQEELATTGGLFHYAAYAFTRTGDLPSAVVTLESGRARGLRETLARDRADLERVKTLDPELYDNYQEIAERLRNLEAQERLRKTVEAGNEIRNTPEANLQQIQQTRQQLKSLTERIRQLPGYETFFTLPTFEDISASLQPNQPLIYLTTTEYGSLALILHRTASEITITLLSIDTLTDAGLRELLNRQNNSRHWYTFASLDRVTGELWSKLMRSVISHLQAKEVKQAILIPTGLLGLLPLHAAWTEDPDKPCKRRYALDEIAFTYAPNALALPNARDIARRISPDTLLAVNNPNNNLPNTEKEVKTAVETFPTHRIFRHEQATQTAVLNALPDYSVLHFACHGSASFAEPLNSGLVMANDEILTLRDLFELKLTGVRLAVLSACETGLPGIDTIDEVVSLPIGMLQAGVAGVVASLWPVDDRCTMMLMVRFYDLWRRKQLEPSEALRQAQQWLRDTTDEEKAAYYRDRSGRKFILDEEEIPERDPSHPFYWSAFTYTGV